MFCSTIIPTIARKTLSRAVKSVLEQSFTAADFEVIVVNDSGQPLPEADWQYSKRVRIINTNRRERVFARNCGAVISTGKYLHFLDDDDWLLPGALNSFWELSQTSDAHWLYGISQLVDRQGRPLILLDHGLSGNCFINVMAGEWIPLQSSLIKAGAFFAQGGFSPLIIGPEDIDLSRRIALHGDFAGAPAIVACIGMGSEGSSTISALSPGYSRRAREDILNERGVFSRLHSSANSDYWRGRIVRLYLTSFIWNLQHRKAFTAASRATFGMAGFALAGRSVVSAGFWRAIKGPYINQTFSRGFEADSLPLKAVSEFK